MKKDIELINNEKFQKKPKHSDKVKKLGISGDELNKEKTKGEMTPEENYEFNTKTKIPADMEIGYKDNNPKNKRFANLTLVPKK